jgi:hypothetical protein
MQQMSGSARALTLLHLVRVLAAIAVVILAVGVLYAAFGPHVLGPTYQVIPDPAGPLPF